MFYSVKIIISNIQVRRFNSLVLIIEDLRGLFYMLNRIFKLIKSTVFNFENYFVTIRLYFMSSIIRNKELILFFSNK